MERALLLFFLILCCAYIGSCGLREDFLSFEGPSEVCLRVSRGESREVFLETPIVFYKKKYSSVFVNALGLISFGLQLSKPYRHRFGINITDIIKFGRTPYLTPFWSFLTKGDACYWQTSNSTIIDNFDDLLEMEGSFDEFKPTLLLVATWKDVIILFDSLQIATFQVILATDGEMSFSQFLYEPIHNRTEYLIGFSAGDGVRGVELVRHTGQLLPEQEDILGIAYRIDGNCVTPSSSPCNYTSYAESCSPPPNITAVCDCNQGYTNISSDNMCEDIDECNEGDHNCTSDRECLNTIGSFSCCSPGYQSDEKTGRCIDIHECMENSDDCPSGEVCFNTYGNFTCCVFGHQYNDMEEICEESSTTEDKNTMSTSETGRPDTTALIAGLVVVGFVLIIVFGVIIIVVLLLTRRKNRLLVRHRVESHEYIDEFDEISGPNFHHAGSMIQLVNLPKALKIPFEDLEIEAKIIGEGEFGIVYRAKYQEKTVAVKILKGISGTYEIRQVVEEILRMIQLSHANILPMTGVSIDHHFSPCIVMPFMWNGSLNAFLQKEENREKFLIPVDHSGSEFEMDTATGKLLEMCLQITKGMAYLSSEKIVHRDLAARNCMVSLHNVIKVADFGLSVTIGEDKDYFRISDSSNEKLPVKWMAVETLIDHKFSEASDVWSYGVTSWEVFNGGRKPYPDIWNRDIVREILGGYRMAKPPNKACNDSIYTMMKSCWEREPKDRPNFADLVTKISSLLEEIKNYLPLMDTQLDTNCNGNDCNISPVNDSKSNFEKEENH